MDMSEQDDMAVEAPPHLDAYPDIGEDAEESPVVVKKIVLNDDDNDFDSMNIRPESLFLRGVDDLSPRNIKLYIDRYVRPDYSFANRDKYESLNYKIEWINDSSLNIVFNDSESALTALTNLSEIAVESLPHTEERRAKEYVNEEGEDKSADLYIRQSFSYDKKIKNAREYSRYYLLHGEPEKADRPRNNYYGDYKKKYRERDSRRARDDEPDLFTGEVKAPPHAEEEDLIPDYRPLADRIGAPGQKTKKKQRPRRNRDDEEDLFPSFVSNNSKRDRSRSPSRLSDDMDIDAESKGRTMEDALGL